MKNIISKLALSTLALIIYSTPAHAAWTSYSIKDGSNRLVSSSTTCQYRMVTFPGWQYSAGNYTLNRTNFDFVDYQYNYQTNPSYQSITFSFKVDENFVDRLAVFIPTNGIVNLGGTYAGSNGNRAAFLSYLNNVRNGTMKFNCSLTTTVPASGSTTPIAPYLSCIQRTNGSDVVTSNSYVLDPASIRIQENCI